LRVKKQNQEPLNLNDKFEILDAVSDCREQLKEAYRMGFERGRCLRDECKEIWQSYFAEDLGGK
jgi:hypothetical protein